MFEKASRLRLRWNFKGNITTEDLWSLSFTELDSLYRSYDEALAKVNKTSGLLNRNASSQVESEFQLRLDIVKHIFTVLRAEADARILSRDKAAKKAKLLELLAEKQDASLRDKSEEEILKMIEDL